MKDASIATAHLIHGFVAAGKTTLARRLEREHGAVRFTHDEWMHVLFGPTPPADRFAELHERVDGLIWEYAGRLLRLGVDVVLDSGFWSRASRARARERVRSLGARPVLYRVSVPDEVARARCARRSGDVPRDSLWINTPALELFRTRFEPLGADEAFVEVDGAAGP
jgi:predicted kinase